MPPKVVMTQRPVPAAEQPGIVMASLPVAQLATGGQVPVKSKAQDIPLYDTVVLDAALNAQRLRFFSAIAGKTIVDTNMPTESQLPSPQTFAVKAFEVSVLADENGVRPSVLDLQAIRAAGWFEFLQGTKPIWRIRLEHLPGPGFVSDVSNDAQPQGGLLNLGTPAISDLHRLDWNLAIGTGLLFGVLIAFSPDFVVTNDYRLRVWARGVWTRSIR